MSGKKRFLRMMPLFLIMYIVLHETGHCIVAVLCGAHITEFNIKQAYMNYEGGHFNDAKNMMLHVNGVLFPVILSYINMLIYPSNTKSQRYRVFSFGFSITSISCLIAWVVVPFIYVFGNPPDNEDATKFLDISCKYVSPFIVTLSAVLVMVLGVLLIIKKELFKSFKETRNMQDSEEV